MTNDEVLTRLQTIYQPETVQAGLPGVWCNRPRLPTSDSVDPALHAADLQAAADQAGQPRSAVCRPLDQFTQTKPLWPGAGRARAAADETEPTVDEIVAAHAAGRCG